MLEFPVSSDAASADDAAHIRAFRVGFWIRAVVVGLLVGGVCGAIPLFFGIRRGRSKLAVAAMISCLVAGAVLHVILAAPTAIVFTAVILAMPRVESERVVIKPETSMQD